MEVSEELSKSTFEIVSPHKVDGSLEVNERSYSYLTEQTSSADEAFRSLADLKWRTGGDSLSLVQELS